MVQSILSFGDIQHIIAIKLCLAVFVISGIIALWRKWHPVVFLSITGILVAASFFLLMDDVSLSFWGLRGDEVTIAAMFEMFAHGSYWSDFAFPTLPPFYPPLFFWSFAWLGNIFGWHGVFLHKVSTFTTFLIFPIMLYAVQAWYWRTVRKQFDIDYPQRLAWFLLPFVFFILVDWDAFILKPYELLAAIGSTLWVVYLLRDLHTHTWSRVRMIVYGVTGGLLFMTYYLWLIFGAMAIAGSGLFVPKKDQWTFYGRLCLVGVLTLIVSLPYLGPLLVTYHRYGTENWGVALMTMRGIALYALMIQWVSWRGLVFLFGFLILLLYRKQIYVRSLLLLFIAGYVWQIMGWATILFFAAPIQEFKAFDFYHVAIIACAVAFGIERAYNFLQKKYSLIDIRIPAGVFGLVLVSVHMIFGTFIDDPVVQARRIESRSLREPVAELVEFLQKNRGEFPGPKTVGPGAGELSAFVPMNFYMYFNQHNNHPGTRFSEAYAQLHILATEKNPQKFHEAVRRIPFGPIDRFILFKTEDVSTYRVYFHVDDFPHGASDTWIDFSKEVFVEPHMHRVFENRTFIVMDVDSSSL